jgi:CRISPR-associated exonuclease Cas4
VEYKSGRQRRGHSEALQLCAQAVCLEEMLNVKIDKGALYWHGSRERKEIILTDALKTQVQAIAEAVHRMIAERRVPQPVNDERCRDCSLKEACLPDVVNNKVKNRHAAQALFTVEKN